PEHATALAGAYDVDRDPVEPGNRIVDHRAPAGQPERADERLLDRLLGVTAGSGDHGHQGDQAPGLTGVDLFPTSTHRTSPSPPTLPSPTRLPSGTEGCSGEVEGCRIRRAVRRSSPCPDRRRRTWFPGRSSCRASPAR